MRLRHIPGAEEKIAASPYVIQDPAGEKGRWKDRFGNSRPIEVEIGMGKGKFIMELARANPDRNYIGIERYPSVLLRGLEKREQMECGNIWFLCMDAKFLPEVFEKGEISKIYLNFSDPWPKDRHAKRRLTSPEFMEVYRQVLAQRGTVEFKTDNVGLFQYSLESVPAAGWEIVSHTFDLHHSAMAEGNVLTEYEEKFAAGGKPICKLICRQQAGQAV